MSKLMIDKVKDFHLDHIFDCGQCFRWNKESDGSYTGVAMGKTINVNMKGSSLIVDNATADDFDKIWRHYLDLDENYETIKNRLSENDKAMKTAIKSGYGIRILNQDLWEVIVSFIISSNNNIPRIKGCIENLCERFGALIGEYRGKKRYSFPTAETLANLTLDDLGPCKLGYRARYIIETAKKYVKDGSRKYESLKDDGITSKQAFDEISKFTGVGPKVANCILLFGLKKKDSFPIDVWMKKVMNHLYDIDVENVKAMESYAVKNFGDNAGIAQQYLFYYMRNKSLGGD